MVSESLSQNLNIKKIDFIYWFHVQYIHLKLFEVHTTKIYIWMIVDRLYYYVLRCMPIPKWCKLQKF